MVGAASRKPVSDQLYGESKGKTVIVLCYVLVQYIC